MKVSDLAENKHGKKVTMHGKTGSRTVLLVAQAITKSRMRVQRV